MNDIIETIRVGFLNIITNMVEYTPSLLTAIIMLLIGWIIARVLRSLVQRLGMRIKFDDIVARTGLASGLQQAQVKQTPTNLLATLIYWIVFLNFILSALNTIGLREAVEPLERLIGFLPQIVAGLITLIIGALLVQFITRAVQGTLAGMGFEFHQSLAGVVQVILMGIVVIVVIDQMGLDTTLLTNMFTNLVTILIAGAALAFGLGGRSVARNVLAGFYARELFETGDRLVIDGEEGVLEGIGTLNSEIVIGDDIVTIPNTRLTEDKVRVKTPQ